MPSLTQLLQNFRSLPTLISADDTWTLRALILSGVAIAIYLVEQTYK